MSAGSDASSAGLVAGSFGLGLVLANLIAFKLGSLLPPWLMLRGCDEECLDNSMSVAIQVITLAKHQGCERSQQCMQTLSRWMLFCYLVLCS